MVSLNKEWSELYSIIPNKEVLQEVSYFMEEMLYGKSPDQDSSHFILIIAITISGCILLLIGQKLWYDFNKPHFCRNNLLLHLSREYKINERFKDIWVTSNGWDISRWWWCFCSRILPNLLTILRWSVFSVLSKESDSEGSESIG